MKQAKAEQRYAANLDAVYEVYTNPDNYLAMTDLTRVAPVEEVSRTDDGSVAVLAMRFKFIAPLSSAVTAVIDPDKLTWIQTHTVNRSSGQESIAFAPDHYEKMLDFDGGAAEYKQIGTGNSIRTIQGSFGIKGIPFFVRGAVEGAIASGLEEYFGEEAEQMRGLIES